MDDPGDAPLRRMPTLAKPPFAAIKKRLSHRLQLLFSGRCCTKGTQILGSFYNNSVRRRATIAP